MTCVVLCSCQNNKAKIKDEDNLKHILGVSNFEYTLVYELDELEKMNEGIYLASIKPSDKSFREIMHNLQTKKAVSLSPKYTISNWKSTPTEEVPFDIFNYNPTTKQTNELLTEISEDLRAKNNFFLYTIEKEYAQNMNLYIIDVDGKKIKIYQTYF